MRRSFLTILILAGLSFNANINAQVESIIRKTIPFKNDLVLNAYGLKSFNFDRDYTMGIGFSRGSSILQSAFIFKPLWWLCKTIGNGYLLSPELYKSWQIFNFSYTPDNLKRYDVINDDRPYASLTAFETSISYFNLSQRKRRTASLSFGILGTRLSAVVQRTLHVIFNRQRPNGWPNQVSDSGEPTLLYSFQEDWLLGYKSTFNRNFQARLGYLYSLGYFASAGGVLEMRFGVIDPQNWLDQSSHNTSVLGFFPRNFKSEEFVFLTLRPRITLYNAVLNGQFIKNIHAVNFAETKHFVVEADGGINLTFPYSYNKRAFNIVFSITAQTPEFEFESILPRWHFWGSLDISFWKIKYVSK